jgi:hypothetical protein
MNKLFSPRIYLFVVVVLPVVFVVDVFHLVELFVVVVVPVHDTNLDFDSLHVYVRRLFA